jgi:hypothetical protein
LEALCTIIEASNDGSNINRLAQLLLLELLSWEDVEYICKELPRKRPAVLEAIRASLLNKRDHQGGRQY